MVHELVICRVEPEPRWHLNLALHLPSLPSPPLLCLFLSVVLDLLSRCSWSQVQEEAGSFSGFLQCRLHHRSLTARQGFIYRDTLEGLREASRRQYPAWIYPYFNSDTWVIKEWREREGEETDGAAVAPVHQVNQVVTRVQQHGFVMAYVRYFVVFSVSGYPSEALDRHAPAAPLFVRSIKSPTPHGSKVKPHPIPMRGKRFDFSLARFFFLAHKN